MKRLTSVCLIYILCGLCLGKEENKLETNPNFKNGIYVPVESSYSFTVDKNNMAHPTLSSFGVLCFMLPHAILSVDKPSFLKKSIHLDSQELTLADVIKYLYKIDKTPIYLLDKEINPSEPRWKSYKFRCGAAKYSYAFLLQIFISVYNELWAFRLKKPEDKKNMNTITYAEFKDNKVFIRVAFYTSYSKDNIAKAEVKTQKTAEDILDENPRITEDYSNRSIRYIINDLRAKVSPLGVKVILETKDIDYVMKSCKCEGVYVVSLLEYLLNTVNKKFGKKFDLKIQGKKIIIFENDKPNNKQD